PARRDRKLPRRSRRRPERAAWRRAGIPPRHRRTRRTAGDFQHLAAADPGRPRRCRRVLLAQPAQTHAEARRGEAQRKGEGAAVSSIAAMSRRRSVLWLAGAAGVATLLAAASF